MGIVSTITGGLKKFGNAIGGGFGEIINGMSETHTGA